MNKKIKWLITSLSFLALPVLAGAQLPPFDGREQAAMVAYQQTFKTIKTQGQVLAAYRQALKLKQLLEPRLEKHMEALMAKGVYPEEADIAALAAQLPGLMPRLVAEGTVMALMPDFVSYAKAAAKTPEAADNAYFALMQQAYGPSYTDYPVWFNQTWDYGGCTWLGKGLQLKLMQEVQRLRKAQNPFTPELKQLEDEILSDLQQSNSFCLSRSRAVQEFKQLLPLLPAASRPGLQQRLKQIQTDKALEFDCESARQGQCHYGA